MVVIQLYLFYWHGFNLLLNDHDFEYNIEIINISEAEYVFETIVSVRRMNLEIVMVFHLVLYPLLWTIVLQYSMPHGKITKYSDSHPVVLWCFWSRWYAHIYLSLLGNTIFFSVKRSRVGRFGGPDWKREYLNQIR